MELSALGGGGLDLGGDGAGADGLLAGGELVSELLGLLSLEADSVIILEQLADLAGLLADALASLELAVLVAELLEGLDVELVVSGVVDELGGAVLDQVLNDGKGLRMASGRGARTLKICLQFFGGNLRVFQRAVVMEA